jgi:UDP-2,3-diacylglucosamine pyrophosphatase LpxH
MERSIRWVCLSDVHFGEEDSLLTAVDEERYACDHRRPSRVLESLCAGLRAVVEANPDGRRPTLVLAGDILELAFASYSQSLATFERFAELVARPGEELFDRIIYLPGNHDHHVWEVARETKFVNEVLRERLDESLPAARHTTSCDADGAVRSFMLGQVMRHVRGLHPDAPLDYPIEVVYPNLAACSEDRSRCVLFHHGHYLEQLYMFMTALRKRLLPGEPPPRTVEQLESENFAWIDFVWSLLGRSGAAGAAAETLYKKLQYPMNLIAFVDDLAARIAETTDIPFVPGEWMERKVLGAVFRYAAEKLAGDRCKPKSVSDEMSEGLHEYLFEYGYRQLEGELGAVPDEMTFVFGHTHKPFESTVEDPRGRLVRVYNAGGWTVDSADPTPNHGAAMVLVDEHLDAVSVRLWEDAATEPSLEVRTAHSDPALDELADQVRARVDPALRPCAERVAQAAALRRGHLARLYHRR